MAESTLSLSIDDLKAEIGHFLGYGRGTPAGESAWTTAQANNITAVLKSGLQQFYTPPALSEREAPHSWSFLRPFASITLTSGQYTIALPDDFGYFEGPVYITTPATAWRRVPLQITNEGLIQGKIAALPDTTGAPRMAALSPIAGTTLTTGTRYNLIVWPKPDAGYVLSYEYKHLPDMLTGLLPYPPGGSEHAATIKAAVLSAAEMELDDVQGVRYAQFMSRLTASIAVDRKKKGTNLGYNGDPRMRSVTGRRFDWRDFDNPPVTYNGSPL